MCVCMYVCMYSMYVCLVPCIKFIVSTPVNIHGVMITTMNKLMFNYS